MTGAPPPEPGPVDRALKVFGDVRAGEGATVLLMSFNVFVLLVAYDKPLLGQILRASGPAADVVFVASCDLPFFVRE